MTDRDRLKEIVQNGVDTTPREEYEEEISMARIIENIVDVLIANGVTVNEWISVEERLPDTDDNVLVICNGEYKNINFINAYELAEYDSDEDEWILDSYPEAVVTVTHWMPLPEPPKEVE